MGTVDPSAFLCWWPLKETKSAWIFRWWTTSNMGGFSYGHISVTAGCSIRKWKTDGTNRNELEGSPRSGRTTGCHLFFLNPAKPTWWWTGETKQKDKLREEKKRSSSTHPTADKRSQPDQPRPAASNIKSSKFVSPLFLVSPFGCHIRFEIGMKYTRKKREINRSHTHTFSLFPISIFFLLFAFAGWGCW